MYIQAGLFLLNFYPMSLLKRDKNNRIYFELTRAANTHYTQNEHTHTHTHVDRKSGINPDLSRRVI